VVKGSENQFDMISLHIFKKKQKYFSFSITVITCRLMTFFPLGNQRKNIEKGKKKPPHNKKAPKPEH